MIYNFVYFSSDACTPPFESVGGSCLFYSGDLGYIVDSYEAATQLCANDGGRLAIVDTGDKNTAILEAFFAQKPANNGKYIHFNV